MVNVMTTTPHPAAAEALKWIRSSGPKKLLICGEWVLAKSGKTFDTIDPATEQVLVAVAEADKADVDAAVTAARRAYEAPSWSGITAHARGAALLRIHAAVEQHADELAAIEA